MVKKITNNDLNEAKKGAAVVDFSAVWCGPCQMLAPVMEELSEELSGKAEFYNADSDENMGLAQEYRIVSIPAVIVLKMAWKWQERLDSSRKTQCAALSRNI